MKLSRPQLAALVDDPLVNVSTGDRGDPLPPAVEGLRRIHVVLDVPPDLLVEIGAVVPIPYDGLLNSGGGRSGPATD